MRSQTPQSDLRVLVWGHLLGGGMETLSTFLLRTVHLLPHPCLSPEGGPGSQQPVSGLAAGAGHDPLLWASCVGGTGRCG